jgi:hypothetical protein
MEKSGSIKLTKPEALSIFSFLELNPLAVVKEKQKQLDTNFSERTLYDCKALRIIVKTYLNYKSDDIRFVVQELCRRFIEDIYNNGKRKRSMEELKFIISIIFRYRNLKDYRLANKMEFSVDYLENVRQNLLQLNAITTYQKELF